MTREGIKDIINNSYKYSSEGFLIDVDLASERIVKYFDQETQRLKAELAEKDKEIRVNRLHLAQWDKDYKELEDKEKDWLNHFDNISEDFSNIEKRLKGHLSAETKLRIKLQSELSELKEKHKRDVETAFSEGLFLPHDSDLTAEQYYSETHKTK